MRRKGKMKEKRVRACEEKCKKGTIIFGNRKKIKKNEKNGIAGKGTIEFNTDQN
jgi:hypothetical protein